MPLSRFTSQESGLFSFRVATRQSERKRKPLFRVSDEAVGIALMETRREEVRVHFPCKVSIHLKFPTFRLSDCFAACKLNCNVRGWKGMSAYTKLLDAPNQFPNYVLPPNSPPLSRPPARRRTYNTKTAALKSSAADGLLIYCRRGRP